MDVPNLRFPEFTEEWKILPFGKTITLQRGSSPRPIVKYITDSCDGVNWVKIGDMPVIGNTVTKTEQKITKIGAKKSRKVEVGDLILSNSMSFGKPYIMGIEGYIHDGWFVIRNYQDSYTRDFLSNLLISDAVQSQYKRIAAGGVVLNISSDLVNSVKVGVPPLQEQEKISAFLKLIDERITTQKKIIEDLKQLRVAIRSLLFKNINLNHSDYTEIGAVLDYEHPDLYIVRETEYSTDKNKIPVLTANKSFILGYTYESFGVYNKGNCIIFDDFTMDVKYIDFPFKVKSSAIKILTAKDGTDLYFMYEYLQYLHLISEEHKRHYISEVADIALPQVPIKQQERVAKILKAISHKIEVYERIADSYIRQKQYLLQQMFI